MKKTALVALAIAAIFWLLNPGLNSHQEKVAESYGSGLARGLARLAIGIGGLQYHDYLFFSTTTGGDGNTLSVGLLGKVIVLQK